MKTQTWGAKITRLRSQIEGKSGRSFSQMTEPTLHHHMLSLYSSVPDLGSTQTQGERILGTPNSPRFRNLSFLLLA